MNDDERRAYAAGWNDAARHYLAAVFEQIDDDERDAGRALHQVNRNVIRLGRMVRALGGRMATAEQVAAVDAAVKRLQSAEDVTETEVREVITALQAHQGDTPDPVLAAAIDTLGVVADKLEKLGTDEAPPPAAGPTTS